MQDKPIFKSKRFVSAIVGLLVMVLVSYVPELADMETELVNSLTVIIMGLISGYTITDTVRDWLNNRQNPNP